MAAISLSKPYVCLLGHILSSTSPPAWNNKIQSLFASKLRLLHDKLYFVSFLEYSVLCNTTGYPVIKNQTFIELNISDNCVFANWQFLKKFCFKYFEYSVMFWSCAFFLWGKQSKVVQLIVQVGRWHLHTLWINHAAFIRFIYFSKLIVV